MEQQRKRLLIGILIIVALGIVGLIVLNLCYSYSEVVRQAFGGREAPMGLLMQTDSQEAQEFSRADFWARVSIFIFLLIFMMQFSAFYLGYIVISGIRRSSDRVKVKFAKLKNADIFADLPLYIGLFGTVSSFLILTFSLNGSRLMAYSSTLVGIIFSVAMRLAFVYPLHQQLVNEASDGELG